NHYSWQFMTGKRKSRPRHERGSSGAPRRRPERPEAERSDPERDEEENLDLEADLDSPEESFGNLREGYRPPRQRPAEDRRSSDPVSVEGSRPADPYMLQVYFDSGEKKFIGLCQ